MRKTPRSRWLCIAAGVAISVTTAQARQLPELECLIEPFDVIDVGSPTHGVVETVAVERSDLVDEKAILARLDASQQIAAVRKARARAAMQSEVRTREAELALAQRKQQRMRELYNSEAISSHQRDEVETELKRAQLQLRQARDARALAQIELDRARDDLERRTIRSPISGIVVERFVAAGEYVNEKPLMRIAQMHPLRVEALAPAEMYGKIKPGMRARVTAEAGGDGPFDAAVTIVDRTIDAASGTFGIRLELPNPDYAIPGGLNCRLQLLEPAAEPRPSRASAEDQPRAASTPKPVKQAAVPATVPADAPLACRSFGPLPDVARRDALASELRAHAVEVRNRTETGLVIAGFFVLTPAYDSLEAARAAVDNYRTRGVTDLALLTRPPNAGRISLGLYDRENNARERQQELQRAGIETDVRQRIVSAPVHWLDADIPTDKLAQAPWRKSLRGIETGPCDTAHYVASGTQSRVPPAR